MAYDSRESLMSTPMDQFEPPKLIPDGHYYGQIIRHPEWRTANTQRGERDILSYPVQLIEPSADVDEAQLVGVDLREIEMPLDFFITKPAMFFLRQFHKSLGFDESQPADSILPETVGRRVLVNVTHRTYKDRRTGEDRSANQIADAVGVL